MNGKIILLCCCAMLLEVNISAQLLKFPDDTSARKHHIRQIKEWYYTLEKDDQPLLGRKGTLEAVYKFNRQGQLQSCRTPGTKIRYAYNYKGKLVREDAIWGWFTYRAWERTRHSSIYYTYDEVAHTVTLKEYFGRPLRKGYPEKEPIQIVRVYQDSLGRDTLIQLLQFILQLNDSANYTGYSRYTYREITGKAGIEREENWIYNFGEIDTGSATISVCYDQYGRISKVIEGDLNSNCPITMYVYNRQGLLTRKDNCECHDFFFHRTLYEYTFFE